MISLDTNVLARFYVTDSADAEAIKQQRQAVKLLSSSQTFFVTKTVLLEFEWVLRGFYKYDRSDILKVLDHLCAIPAVTFEDQSAVSAALSSYRAGLDFADALHLASSAQCTQLASFDNRGFLKVATRLNLKPQVIMP